MKKSASVQKIENIDIENEKKSEAFENGIPFSTELLQKALKLNKTKIKGSKRDRGLNIIFNNPKASEQEIIELIAKDFEEPLANAANFWVWAFANNYAINWNNWNENFKPTRKNQATKTKASDQKITELQAQVEELKAQIAQK